MRLVALVPPGRARGDFAVATILEKRLPLPQHKGCGAMNVGNLENGFCNPPETGGILEVATYRVAANNHNGADEY
jgi:hypothetical protein